MLFSSQKLDFLFPIGNFTSFAPLKVVRRDLELQRRLKKGAGQHEFLVICAEVGSQACLAGRSNWSRLLYDLALL